MIVLQVTDPVAGWRGRVLPLFFLYGSVFAAIGVLLLVIAASILARRVWRRDEGRPGTR